MTLDHAIGDIPIYYINLERSKDRNNNILSQFSKHNVTNYKRIDAIDGTVLNMDSLNYKIKPCRTVSEIACTLSHLKAIKQAFDNGCEIAMIMEDDINFGYIKHQPYTIKQIIDSNNQYDIYQLCWVTHQNKILENLCEGNQVTPGYLDCTCCYVIKRSGMKKVLADNQIDVADIHIYRNGKTCYLNRPYFTYYYTFDQKSTIVHGSNKKPNNDINLYENKNKFMIDKYYKVISLWDAVYCTARLTPDCAANIYRLFNKNPNLPIQRINNHIEALHHAQTNGYNRILIFDDNIDIDKRWFLVLYDFIQTIKTIDVLDFSGTECSDQTETHRGYSICGSSNPMLHINDLFTNNRSVISLSSTAVDQTLALAANPNNDPKLEIRSMYPNLFPVQNQTLEGRIRKGVIRFFDTVIQIIRDILSFFGLNVNQ